MHVRQAPTIILAAALAATAAACGGSPPASNTSTGGMRTAASAPGTTANKVNIDEIFPAGRGRDLVLNNCQTCHTFVPIVVLQMDKDAWQRNSLDHRQRVPGVSDEDFKELYEYLSSNFNPSRPVPVLPKELLESWTSY